MLKLTRNRKMVSSVFFIFLFAHIFSGCFARKMLTRKKTKKTIPKILVLPFVCENDLVTDKITRGFMDGLGKKYDALDQRGFELWFASRPAHLEDYFGLERSSPISTARPIAVSVSSGAFRQLAVDLFKKGKEDLRVKFYHESEVEYLVIGQAKEKVLDELELGNLITADAAEMKLFEFKSGELLLEERFKQGFFEVVAPDRIGSKFASASKKVLNQIQKRIKREEKERQKRLLGQPYSQDD